MALPSKCPLCGAGPDKQSVVTSHVYGGGPGRAFYRCSACDVVHLFPRLTDAEEKLFYAQEFSKFMAARAGAGGGWSKPEEHIAANAPTVERRMRYLNSALPKKGRILEYGCSSGFMLYPLAAAGHACAGVEPADVFGAFVRSKGVPCFSSQAELLADPAGKERFDLVMHFFVLEHVADPAAFLKAQVETLLKAGGKLVFEIPSCDDPLYTVYDIPEFESFYWSIAHQWYFSAKSLKFLLESIGYKHRIILEQRYDLSNHMVWARDGKSGGMGRFTPKLGEEVEEAYRQALIRSGHCDTLVAVLEKDAA